MDADEKDILLYLKNWPGQFVSGREIARKAASKRRFEAEPNWAVPALGRLMEKEMIESDSMAHYRLIPEVDKTKKKKKKRWIAPHLQKILAKTGKDYGEGVEIDPEHIAAAATAEPEKEKEKKTGEPPKPGAG